jgi:hypothetical protein
MKYDLMESKEPNFSSTFLRRVILLDKVLEDYLPLSFPCDYKSPKGYLEGIASDFFYLIEDENVLQIDGDRELLAWFYADVYDYITIMKKDELIEYWNLSCNKEESEINESTNNKERSLIPYIRRRIPGDVLLDEFYDSLEKAKEWFERDYKKEFKIMSFSNFEYITLSMTMDGIHWMLMDSSPSDVQWYDHAFNGLKQFFGGILKKEYNKVIEKNGLLPLNESRIPTETDYLGWEVPRELYDELDKIGVKRYDKKNDKIYVAEFHFDNEAVVFEILDLYGEIYGNSEINVPIEYNSHHTIKLKDLPKKVKRYLLRRIKPKWIEYFKANNQKSSLNENVSKKNKLEDKMTEFLYKLTKDDKFPETFKEFKLELVYNPYIYKNTNLYIISIMEPGFTTRKESPSDELTINNILVGHLNKKPSLFRSIFGGFFNIIYKEYTTEKDLPKLMRYIRGEDMHFQEITKAQQQPGHDDNWTDNLLEDLKPWGVSNATKNKYKMGPLDEEEDFQEDEVLKETKLQKIVNHYIEKLLKDEELPESFLEFKTFTLNDTQTPRSGSKILYVIPVFRDDFMSVPYRDWETLEKVFKPLVKKLEAAFVGHFNKVTTKPPKTPKNYIKTIKSLSKFGNRI